MERRSYFGRLPLVDVRRLYNVTAESRCNAFAVRKQFTPEFQWYHMALEDSKPHLLIHGIVSIVRAYSTRQSLAAGSGSNAVQRHSP